LADRLWLPFVDLDERIVQQEGKSIKEIFEQEGEARFRDLETAHIEEAARLQEHVIALGGGAMGRERNRELIHAGGHRVIYLRCDPDELARRILNDPLTAAMRPSLTGVGHSAEEVRQVLEMREPIYRQAAHAELDVTSLTPDEAVVYLARMM
jgi:shikimate kinase